VLFGGQGGGSWNSGECAFGSGVGGRVISWGEGEWVGAFNIRSQAIGRRAAAWQSSVGLWFIG